MRSFSCCLMAATLCLALPALGNVHSADSSRDGSFSLSEVLRVIQFYNAGAYHLDSSTEDGYAPGTGETGGTYHDADYAPADWHIGLVELLRLIQLYNLGAYNTAPGSEDGFAPAPERDPHLLPVAGDSDGDLLSDYEETLLGLDPMNPHVLDDTQGDGTVLAARITALLENMPACQNDNGAAENGWCLVVHDECECDYALDTLTGTYILRGKYVSLHATDLPLEEEYETRSDWDISAEALHFLSLGSFNYYAISLDDDPPEWPWIPERLHRFNVLKAVSLFPELLPEGHAPHLLPVPGDRDGDLLSDTEEDALGLNADEAHEFGEAEVDGIVLAKRVFTALEAWGWCAQEVPEGTHCVVPWEADCGCVADPVTGTYVCLASFREYFLGEEGEPRLLFTLPDEARHFMGLGSFSYFPLPCGAAEPGETWVWDPAEITRLDVATIVKATIEVFPTQ